MATCCGYALNDRDRMGSKLICPRCGRVYGGSGSPVPNAEIGTGESQFRVRSSVFSAERSYGLTGDALEIATGTDRDAIRIPYAEIQSVRLQYTGMGWYRCVIRAPRIKLALVNRHYRGYADYEDRNAGYRQFVLGLHRKLESHGRRVKFLHGSNWLFALALGLNILLFLGGAGLVWLMLNRDFHARTWLFLIALPVAWGAMYGIVRRGRAKEYDGTVPPGELLPPPH